MTDLEDRVSRAIQIAIEQATIDGVIQEFLSAARAAIAETRVEEMLSKLKNARNILVSDGYVYAKEIDVFLESLKSKPTADGDKYE